MLKLPLPDNLSGWTIKLRTRASLKLIIDYDDQELVIKAPDPEALWDQIQLYDAIFVENGDIVPIKIEDFESDNTNLYLEVTVQDDDGNANTVSSHLYINIDD